MFGSTTPFGQSTNSPFGTPSVFGQTNNATNNPFAPKGFGSGSPFGSQTGTSMFGGTSTGVFGATPSSSSLASTPAFGASSPAFGSSAFGAASTPAFGTGSSSFGGSSVFGQKPAFGGFGSTPGQSNPFGSTFQQSQPAFGNSLFGSTTPFGASSTPAFGATSTPAFGATSTPAFGATSTPAFGSTSTPAFGSAPTPTFGSTGSVFGTSSTPAFGASSTPAFGASSTPVFGSSSTPAFGATSTPAFGSSNTPAFGASSAPSFTFGSSPAFGQSTAAFGSSTFGTTPFGSQSSPFGAQSTTPAFGSPGFGQQAFGGQRGGTRVVSYTPTSEVDGGSGTQPAGKLESIAAMPAYKDKSHEELRWEDYQLGDKGGPNPASQPASGIGFGAPAQSSPFGTSGTFGQPSANPFSSSTTSNPFAPKTQTFGSTGFGASSSPAFSSPFGVTSSSPFGSTTSSTTPSMFGPATTPAFGATSSTSLFGAPSTPAFGASSSSLMFGSTSAGSSPAFGSALNFSNTQASGLFQSSTPSLGQTSIFGSATPTFGQTTNSSFGQQNPFSTPSAGFGGNLFTSNSAPSMLNTSNPIGFGQPTLSLSSPFTAPAQTSGAFSFGNFGQIQPAASTGFGGVSNAFGQGNFGQLAPGQNNLVAQPMPVTNPFGTLPAMPQMSIGRAGSSPSIQYGISSMPVADKPAPIRISSLLTSRHLSQRRIRLPPRKYHPKNDGPKIPFFSDEEAAPSTPKADALFIPRENPRALVIRPMEQRPSRAPMEKQSHQKDVSTPGKASGKDSAPALNGGSAPVLNGSVARDHQETNGFDGQENTAAAKLKQKPNGIHHEVHGGKGDSYITVSGHRAGEAAIVYEHGADIKVLMPKLRHADYFTEPPIQELAAKERVEPGYCRRVKDFVVGRHGYGSIRFFGETDVRSLDLESLLQFNNKEVIVYMDESKKPPVGQGLNKPAEVTLLNVKCFNKKTGQQYTEGPRMEKYKEMLIKKAEDQDAEFVSYDPVKGEWKFRVNHFSRYVFEGECWNDGDHISSVR